MRAKAILKQVRVPESGQPYEKALKSADHRGPVAHHAAWLLHHARKIEAHLAAGEIEYALEQARLAGGREALITHAKQNPKPPRTDEEDDFMTRQVRRRDKEAYGSAKANAESQKRWDKRIDPADFDRRRKQGESLEDIATAHGVSLPFLRGWRNRNNRP